MQSLRFILFYGLSALSACVSVYHMHAGCLWRSEEGNGSPGAGIVDGCESPHKCWELTEPDASAGANKCS